MNKLFGFVLVVVALVVFPLMFIANVASTGGSSGASFSCDLSQTSARSAVDTPFQTLVEQSEGDNRLVAAGLIGSYLESGWNPGSLSGDGAVGLWQIQSPGRYPNPGISREEALDPVASTEYMLPRYREALEKVDASLWATNPEYAAATVAYKAERPKYPYHVGQSPAKVRQAWQATLAKMTEFGLNTNFGSGRLGPCSEQSSVQIQAGTWQVPIESGRYRVTSRFGEIARIRKFIAHDGIDLAAPHGTPIHAALGGKVVFAGGTSSPNWRGFKMGFRGLYVVIDHGIIDGRHIVTRYHHMSTVAVNAGDVVQAGDVIGGVGSTGNSDGNHVHFAIEVDGTPVNPETYYPVLRAGA